MSDLNREEEAKTMFRSADGLVVVADLTSVNSVVNLNQLLYDSTMGPVLDGLQRWMKSVQNYTTSYSKPGSPSVNFS